MFIIKAHDSVEKYPIPFQHPAETVILNGIGPTLIQKLERKLKQYCEENRLPMPLRPGSFQIILSLLSFYQILIKIQLYR